ncbi:transposase domain-containing protein [Pararoseomonas sp. SCSIO 73927]|uniref:transposase domain-containing protein n=1 Tax=Pararoseomonas sp. SCSIO 73927 TaxID=3114537 RepID=UPI0030D070C6
MPLDVAPSSITPLRQEWFTAAELAALGLQGIPTTKRGVNMMADAKGWSAPEREGGCWRMRQGQGGGLEYHYSVLPAAAQAKLTHTMVVRAPEATRMSVAESWAWFDRQTETKKRKAREKLEALDQVDALVLGGVDRTDAVRHVAQSRGISWRVIYDWSKACAHAARADRLPCLVPRNAGDVATAEMSPDAWTYIKSEWLRQSQPSFQACWRRLVMKAEAEGWTIPHERTVRRRLQALPAGVKTLLRKGADALREMIPDQERDRAVFHALEAVNADGHTWDVRVQWPGIEKPVRPVMVAFQDLYSGKILAWRLDTTLSWHAVRVAFGDLIEGFGIPSHCWLDNGREFANKRMTGGQANRYRFKVQADDPDGLMTTLGVKVHWTKPYSGQSKPIERAFRDFAQDLAKHPAFEGAYTGNSPTNKPSNYGSRVVPLDVFRQVVEEGVREHNARLGRRSVVCAGRSFDQVFAESYAASGIRQGTAEQRRMWLLSSEPVKARAPDGAIHLYGNRYWGEFLHGCIGQKVVARFDPDALHEPMHVYALDGRYLGAAAAESRAGFADVEAAATQERRRKDFVRKNRAKVEAEGLLSLTELAKAAPRVPKPPVMEPPRLVRPLFAGNTALKAAPAAAARKGEAEDLQEEMLRGIAHARPLRLISGSGGDA